MMMLTTLSSSVKNKIALPSLPARLWIQPPAAAESLDPSLATRCSERTCERRGLCTEWSRILLSASRCIPNSQSQHNII